MRCCTDGELSRNSARDACSRAIRTSIEASLDDDVFGVVVNAIPTLGKSRTAATIATDLSDLLGEELDVSVLTHRKETRDQIKRWAEEAGLNPHQLPRFDEDCPPRRANSARPGKTVFTTFVNAASLPANFTLI